MNTYTIIQRIHITNILHNESNSLQSRGHVTSFRCSIFVHFLGQQKKLKLANPAPIERNIVTICFDTKQKSTQD